MWQEVLNEFVTLVVVLNPIAAIPVFLAATGSLEPSPQRKVALYGVLISFGVLLFFIFAGGSCSSK